LRKTTLAMRKFIYSFIFLLYGGFFAQTFAQGGDGIVSSCGRLKVANGHVCTESGDQVSLAGMSMFWSGWASKYYTAATVNYLVDKLKVSVVRAAYGCPSGSGPQGDIQDIKNVVEACIARNVYVIIDWHIEGDNTPYQNQEISFFQSMVQQYGKNKHVIYELWNEPTTSPTQTIKDLCQTVANSIRATEDQNGYGHNLIICGSQTWSQYPNLYTITDPNAAYTFHGYFDNQAGHYSQLTTNAKAAMDKGNAVFVTEFGASYCNHTSTDKAIAWCQANNISMCAWSVNDKVEDWSIFTNNMDALTCIGTYYQSKMTTWPSPIAAKVYPTAVAANPSTVNLPTIGSTIQLSPVFTPANTNQMNVKWSSSNNANVSVSASGLVTGLVAGTETITVTASDQNSVSISGTCVVTVQNLVNLALNKTVVTSSDESSQYSGAKAVDGLATTRWSTAFSDPQYIQVDLGASYNITGVSISWEAASAKDYTIQVSADGTNWTTISTQTGITTGERVDNPAVSGTGRYIKINGTARNTVYGYSMYEFAVYGTAGAVVHPTGLVLTPATNTVKVGATAQLSASVSPNNATNPTVTWASSNTAVASVTATGLVTAVSAGDATITATTVDGNIKATAKLTVTPATAIQEVDESSAVEARIYPNPSQGEVVKLELKGFGEGLVQVEIFNIEGQLVKQTKFNCTGLVNTTLLDSAQLNSGRYLVKVKNAHTSKQVKLLISK